MALTAGLDVAVAADHHHRHVGIGFLDHLQDLHAVERAVLQPDVEHDQAGTAVAQQVQRLVAVGGLARGESLVAEHAGDQHPDVGFVIDNQDIARHAMPRTLRVLISSLYRFQGRVGKDDLRREGQPHRGAALLPIQ
jgi:hypothetical protein